MIRFKVYYDDNDVTQRCTFSYSASGDKKFFSEVFLQFHCEGHMKRRQTGIYKFTYCGESSSLKL